MSGSQGEISKVKEHFYVLTVVQMDVYVKLYFKKIWLTKYHLQSQSQKLQLLNHQKQSSNFLKK